jgi:Terpene cyclase DEP1
MKPSVEVIHELPLPRVSYINSATPFGLTMTSKDKFICATYALIALLALPATWINNIAFMSQPHNNSLMDFVNAAYVNAAAASLSNDLLFVATAASMFMVIEGRRVGVRFLWLYIIFSALIAISVTFPLFLLARHLKITTAQNESTGSTTESFKA